MVGLVSTGTLAMAQIPESDGGARLVAGVDFRLQLADGDPEFRTGFNLSARTANRTQRLSFSGDFGLTVPLDDPEAGDFSDPRYRFDYLRDVGDSRFNTSLRYSRSDIGDRFFLLPPDVPLVLGDEVVDDGDPALTDAVAGEFDEDDLILLEGGSEERIRGQAELQVGVTAPFGATLRYSFDDRLYADVTDPDLVDLRRDDVSVTLRFDIDPTLRVTLGADYRLTEEGGPVPETDERTSLDLGARWDVSPDLRLGASLGYADIGRDVADDQNGVDLGLNATLRRPGGAFTFNFDRNLTTTGFVNTAELGSRFALPRGARINTTLGATELPGGDVYPIGSLGYTRATPTGQLSLSLARSAAINGDDDAVLRTVLQGGYRTQLPRGAGLGLSARLTDSEYTFDAEPDVSSARISVDYNQALTENWSFAAGASLQRTLEDGSDADTSSSVFVSLERSFSFRP